jgi:hypothetical protein
MRRRDSLRRRTPFQEPRKRFLIATEGTVTEPHYFNEMRRLLRSIIVLRIVKGGKPKALVERALEEQEKAARAAENEGDDFLRFEEAWCVFDIDDHSLVAEAKQQAREHGIHLAISNPCFELWLLLHFQEQRANIKCKSVQGALRKHLPEYDKKPECEKLLLLLDDAMQRRPTRSPRHPRR